MSLDPLNPLKFFPIFCQRSYKNEIYTNSPWRLYDYNYYETICSDLIEGDINIIGDLKQIE